MIKPRDLPAILKKVNPNFQLKMEKSTKSLLLFRYSDKQNLWRICMDIYRPTDSKDVCALRQVTFGVASETFHFVGFREFALLLKKKHKSKTFVEVN